MKILLTAATAAFVAFGFSASADAATRAGTLSCQGAPRIGAIIGSVQQARCVFTDRRGRREYYSGRMTRIGPDIGITGGSHIVWAVFAPSSLHHRALVGDFVGASGDAAIGVGLGANVLVGGNRDTVSLQPLSVKVQSGLAVGVGIGRLQLR